MHWYESHMGGIYAEEEELPFECLYCDSCGDSDHYLGYAETFEDAWNLMKGMTSFCGYGPGCYDLFYIFSVLCSAYKPEEILPKGSRKCGLTDRKIVRRISEIIGKPVKVWMLVRRFEFLNNKREDDEIRFDFVFAAPEDTKEKLGKKYYTDEAMIKEVI